MARVWFLAGKKIFLFSVVSKWLRGTQPPIQLVLMDKSAKA
jgi:hypothetical protein